MKSSWFVALGMMFGITGVLCMAIGLCAEPSGGESSSSQSNKPSTSDSKITDQERVSVAVARDRAKVMHDIYVATLDVMHHRYFHSERAVVPARAMEDVFSEIKRQSKVEARWISVNLKAMSIDHEPESDFEKKAAEEIATGTSQFELVEGGYYRRAGAIPLTGGCISCHGGLFLRETVKTPKYAGLVISVPIIDDSIKSK